MNPYYQKRWVTHRKSFTTIRITIWKSFGDFPGGPVVKNPPSNAADAGMIPGQGTKIPHAVGQLSPHATTTESGHLN